MGYGPAVVGSFLGAWWAAAMFSTSSALGQDVPGLGHHAWRPGQRIPLGRSSCSTVYVGRRILGATLMLAISVGVALPAASYLGRQVQGRVVGRAPDLVEPPLDIQAAPSPMASFRHYTTDLKTRCLLPSPDLPGEPARIAAMDVIRRHHLWHVRARGWPLGYIPVETAIPGAEGNSTVTVSTNGLSGPWVPVLESLADYFTRRGADTQRTASLSTRGGTRP